MGIGGYGSSDDLKSSGPAQLGYAADVQSGNSRRLTCAIFFPVMQVVIIQPVDTGNKAHPYGHALVAGIERYPSKITRRMSKARQEKRSKIKPFVKVVNYNHLMPTRYTLELEGLKGAITSDTFKEVSQREDAKKTVKKTLEERYTSGKNRWFFTPLSMSNPHWSEAPACHLLNTGSGFKMRRHDESQGKDSRDNDANPRFFNRILDYFFLDFGWAGAKWYGCTQHQIKIRRHLKNCTALYDPSLMMTTRKERSTSSLFGVLLVGGRQV